jgi:Tol biopolymer transport system component
VRDRRPANLGSSHPTIAPDESFLLFDAPRPESRATDLFVMYIKPDGTWTRPVNLGNPINTPERESNPTISTDGKYLFFTRHGKIYRVSAEVLERLKAGELGPP